MKETVAAKRSGVIRRGTYYGSLFLQDNPPSEECYLFVRRYAARRHPKNGRVSVEMEGDVLKFRNEKAMVAAIESERMKPLPTFVESMQDRYIPEEFGREMRA
jgi:hypothetical protein